MREICISLIIGAVAVAAQQRDLPAPPIGTGHLAGVVVDDASPAMPVRRAVVTLTDTVRGDGQTTVADDRGRFTFDGLQGGRFTLSASKGGYVKSMYGAIRAGGLGVPIVLADGGSTTGLSLVLVRGAIITGIVRDRLGAPVRGVQVNAGRQGAMIDDRRPLPDSAGGSSETDDRGVYRIYGLRPGDYLVWITAPRHSGSGATRLTSAEDVQRAQQLIQMARQGAPLQFSPAAPATIGSGVTYANSYYPRTATPDDAVPLRIGPGEERAGVDLTLLLIPTARLAGSVINASGSPVPKPRVWIRPESSSGTRDQSEVRTASDGTFEVLQVVPGEYLLGSEGQTAADRGQWARLSVFVHGADQTGLVLRMKPGLSVTGRVVFEPSPGQVPVASGHSVVLLEEGQGTNSILRATTAADGSFAIDGVPAGRYRVALTMRSSGALATGGWMLKTITGAGPDLADVPLEIGTDGALPHLTITLTTSNTELAGSLLDQAGRPVTALTVVVFSVERTFWAAQSRRIRATRPGDDGRFQIKNLPTGAYFITALADVDEGQWFDPRFLETLVSSSVRITIEQGKPTIHDLLIHRTTYAR